MVEGWSDLMSETDTSLGFKCFVVPEQKVQWTQENTIHPSKFNLSLSCPQGARKAE